LIELQIVLIVLKIIELGDAAFNKEFPGIIDFLYEANEISQNTEDPIKKRIIDLADMLWRLGIHPSEF